MSLTILVLMLHLDPLHAGAERPLPILDMHMHAKAAGDFGPPPRPTCIHTPSRVLLAEEPVRGVMDPQCPEPDPFASDRRGDDRADRRDRTSRADRQAAELMLLGGS